MFVKWQFFSRNKFHASPVVTADINWMKMKKYVWKIPSLYKLPAVNVNNFFRISRAEFRFQNKLESQSPDDFFLDTPIMRHFLEIL